MFDENFTFDTVRSPSPDSTYTTSSASSISISRAASPCSTISSLPPSRLSIADLAAQFAEQRIHRPSQICYDACDAYANNDADEAGWRIDAFINDYSGASTPNSRRTSTVKPPFPSPRAHRQATARLLCTSSHHRDIAALVARMVQTQDQCSFASPEPSPTFSSSGSSEDEGNGGPEGSLSRVPSGILSRPRLDYRRSSDVKTLGSCVSKSARFRRDRSDARKKHVEKAS